MNTGNTYLNISDICRFYHDKKLNFDNEKVNIEEGLRNLIYGINTISVCTGKTPKIYILINTDDIKDKMDEFIIEKFIDLKIKGLTKKDDNVVITKYPQIIYSLNKNNYIGGKYYDITKKLDNNELQYLIMNDTCYQAFVNNNKKFNQGTICLDIYQILVDAIKNKYNILEYLQDKLDACYEWFLCKNHNLQGTYSDKCPIEWQDGLITNLKSGEKIDEYLKKDYSYLNLCIMNLEKGINENDVDKDKIIELINKNLEKWNIESNFSVIASNYFEDNDVDSLEFSNSSKLNLAFSYANFENNDIVLNNDKSIFLHKNKE